MEQQNELEKLAQDIINHVPEGNKNNPCTVLLIGLDAERCSMLTAIIKEQGHDIVVVDKPPMVRQNCSNGLVIPITRDYDIPMVDIAKEIKQSRDHQKHTRFNQERKFNHQVKNYKRR